jgi:hypothetical protein
MIVFYGYNTSVFVLFNRLLIFADFFYQINCLALSLYLFSYIGVGFFSLIMWCVSGYSGEGCAGGKPAR